MSPVGDTLRTRCRNFPGLVNNTSIDWFTAWPRQALHAVASQFLAEVSEIMYSYILLLELHWFHVLCTCTCRTFYMDKCPTVVLKFVFY